MPTPYLHILVIDDRLDSVLPVIDHLVSQGHRVETINSGQRALNGLNARRDTPDAYDLVVCKAGPPIEGLGLLRELRRTGHPVAVALYMPFSEIQPSAFAEAERLNIAMFLDQPVELRRIDQLVRQLSAPAGTSSLTQAGQAGQAEQPFFGTARVARPVGSESSRHLASEQAQPATGSLPHPSTLSSRQQVPTTSRIRRGVTGRIEAPNLRAEPDMGVLCYQCRREFVVVRKREGYNSVCVHCGALNRIEPAG